MAIVDVIRSKYPDAFSKDGSIKDAFFVPDIPEKRINGAIEKIAPNVSPEQIILIVDTTLMGSGKDGLVFTSSAFYYRESFSDPSSVLYSELETAEYIKDVKEIKNGKEKYEEVILPFLIALSSRAYAACFNFMAGVIPPMPMLGRSLL